MKDWFLKFKLQVINPNSSCCASDLLRCVEGVMRRDPLDLRRQPRLWQDLVVAVDPVDGVPVEESSTCFCHSVGGSFLQY